MPSSRRPCDVLDGAKAVAKYIDKPFVLYKLQWIQNNPLCILQMLECKGRYVCLSTESLAFDTNHIPPIARRPIIWAFTPTSSAFDVDEHHHNAYVDTFNLRVGSTRRVLAHLTNHLGLALGNTLIIRWLRGTYGRSRGYGD